MQYDWVFILSLLWFSLSFTVYCLHNHEKQCRQNFVVVIFIYGGSMTANAKCRRKFRGLQTRYSDSKSSWKKIPSPDLFIMTFWLSAFWSAKKINFFKKTLKNSVIDSMTEKAGCSVLRLSPYRCILNPLELARASLEFLYKSAIKICRLNP